MNKNILYFLKGVYYLILVVFFIIIISIITYFEFLFITLSLLLFIYSIYYIGKNY